MNKKKWFKMCAQAVECTLHICIVHMYTLYIYIDLCVRECIRVNPWLREYMTCKVWCSVLQCVLQLQCVAVCCSVREVCLNRYEDPMYIHTEHQVLRERERERESKSVCVCVYTRINTRLHTAPLRESECASVRVCLCIYISHHAPSCAKWVLAHTVTSYIICMC